MPNEYIEKRPDGGGIVRLGALATRPGSRSAKVTDFIVFFQLDQFPDRLLYMSDLHRGRDDVYEGGEGREESHAKDDMTLVPHSSKEIHIHQVYIRRRAFRTEMEGKR